MRCPEDKAAPLHQLDTETQTFGCRHTNPIICANNNMPKKCAFTRKDGICMIPPRSWKVIYKKLLSKVDSDSI